MSEPIVSAPELGQYLSDDSINIERAEFMIRQAQALALSVVNPLPAGAEVVVTRVAGRGYVTATTSRGQQLVAAGSPFGLVPGGVGGIFLTRQDKADLRRMAGGGGAFTINPLPTDYSRDLPPWDSNVTGVTFEITS
jgi:hypothetical protein